LEQPRYLVREPGRIETIRPKDAEQLVSGVNTDLQGRGAVVHDREEEGSGRGDGSIVEVRPLGRGLRRGAGGAGSLLLGPCVAS
jgi:hypothetical protein